MKTCETCNGSGEVEQTVEVTLEDGSTETVTILVNCPECGGTGMTWRKQE